VSESLHEVVPGNSDVCSRLSFSINLKEEAAVEFTEAFFLVKKILFKKLSNLLDSKVLKSVLRIIICLVGLFPG